MQLNCDAAPAVRAQQGQALPAHVVPRSRVNLILAAAVGPVLTDTGMYIAASPLVVGTVAEKAAVRGLARGQERLNRGVATRMCVVDDGPYLSSRLHTRCARN